MVMFLFFSSFEKSRIDYSDVTTVLNYDCDNDQNIESVQLISYLENDESEEFSKIKSFFKVNSSFEPLFQFFVLVDKQFIVFLQTNRHQQTMLDLPPPSC